MILIEHKHQHQSSFDVCERGADGRLKVVRTLYVHYANTVNATGEVRHIIYDEQMRPIPEIYRYLNMKMRGKSPSTISRAVTALRLFVAFCTAHRFRNYIVPEIYCQDFVDFLFRGNNAESSSAIGYFANVRGFLSYIHHDQDPLMDNTVRTIHIIGADGQERYNRKTVYTHSPKANSEKDLMPPEHNSISDFVRIQDVMKKKKFYDDMSDIAGCILVLLMFMYGRRIGEILGLTIEDISTHVNKDTGEVTHCLYFRNRVHDKTGQRAKNRIVPRSREEYQSTDYIKAYNSPRNCICLQNSTYNLIKTYIETYHSQLSKTHPKQYASTVADIVNPKQFAEEWGVDQNHYLFLNNTGGVLLYHTWYKRLKQYFVDADIPVGNGKSPNHSWRHTIAYIMRHMLKMNRREIADVLGHKYESTTDIYTKADYDTLAKLNRVVQDYLNNEIQKITDGIKQQ